MRCHQNASGRDVLEGVGADPGKAREQPASEVGDVVGAVAEEFRVQRGVAGGQAGRDAESDEFERWLRARHGLLPL